MQRLLGDIEIAKQADQRGKYAARFRTINFVHDFAHRFDCVFAHRRQRIRKMKSAQPKDILPIALKNRSATDHERSVEVYLGYF
jgi:hypothetical protein